MRIRAMGNHTRDIKSREIVDQERLQGNNWSQLHFSHPWRGRVREGWGGCERHPASTRDLQKTEKGIGQTKGGDTGEGSFSHRHQERRSATGAETTRRAAAVTLSLRAISARTTGARARTRERYRPGQALEKRTLLAFLSSLAARGVLHPSSQAQTMDQATKHHKTARDGSGLSASSLPITPLLHECTINIMDA
jgi:hypothetical protein